MDNLYCRLVRANTNTYKLKGAVYTVVWIFIYSCMLLELFLFAKKMKCLTEGEIHCISGLPLALLFYARALIGRTDGA